VKGVGVGKNDQNIENGWVGYTSSKEQGRKSRANTTGLLEGAVMFITFCHAQ
jgi:hypothetical protein